MKKKTSKYSGDEQVIENHTFISEKGNKCRIHINYGNLATIENLKTKEKFNMPWKKALKLLK